MEIFDKIIKDLNPETFQPNEFIRSLKDLENVKNDTMVPLEILQYVEKDKQPLLFTKQVLKDLVNFDSVLNGKKKTFEKYLQKLKQARLEL